MLFVDKSPSSPVFTAVTFAQMEQLEAIRTASGSSLYVYTFPSLFSWQSDEKYGICLTDDAFLVKYGARGENAYLFPCGTESGKRTFVDLLLQRERPVFYYTTDNDKAFLEKSYPGVFAFEECRDDFPYLYDKESQIALAGRENKSLRHKVNIGRAAAQTWSSERLTEQNVNRAININRKWADIFSDGGPADTAAAETALCRFSDLHLWGMLFIADGEDMAYVAGTFITPDIFDICFCKVLDKRCDCYIKWALYKALPAEIKTVDSEEDMGLEGLRIHKMQRRPKELLRVWKGFPV